MSFTSSGTPRWSDVWIGAVARAIDNGGDLLAAFSLALVLQARGFGSVAVSGLMLAASVPPIVLARVAGRVADTLDSRRILVMVGSIQVAICAALAFVTSVYAIIGLVVLLTVGATFTSPTFGALTPDMVGKDNLAKASGIMQSAGALASLFAPIFGGLLVGAFHGARVPLLVDAATCLAVPAAGMLIRTRRRGGVAVSTGATAPAGASAVAAAAAATDRLGADIASEMGSARGWSIFRDPILRPLLTLFAAVVAALTAVNVAEVFFVRGTLHGSATLFGLIGAAWMGGMLIGSVALSRLKPDDARGGRLMLALLIAISVLSSGASLVGAAAWLLPLWLVGGALNGAQNNVAGVLIGRRAPSERRGRAFATFGGTMSAASTLGMALGGLLLTVASPRAIFLWSGLASLAIAAPLAGPLLAATRRESGEPTARQPSSAPPWRSPSSAPL